MKNRILTKTILLSMIFIFSFVFVASARVSYRSAKTGRYVTKSYYTSHPATTYKSKR